VKNRSSLLARCLVAAATAVTAFGAFAGEVVDTFESADNPNRWSWQTGGSHYVSILPTGGNPGGWLDSTTSYWSGWPEFSSLPPEGSPLKAALRSGTLTSARVDIQRLDATDAGCTSRDNDASVFTLLLSDNHSFTQAAVGYVSGPERPAGVSFPWMTIQFAIPPSSAETPPGWTLVLPSGVTDYTWADLLANLDGIHFMAASPADFNYLGDCWDFGADNVVVTYGNGDGIFANGFEP
jgi:hypothetical protein